MTTTPKVGAPELVESQADKEESVNEGIRRVEAGAGYYAVVDKDLTAPPGACADGAVYIVAGSPTGLWSGLAKSLATAVGTNAANGWYHRTPEEGTRAYVQDENAEYRYDGSAWGIPSGVGSGDVVGPGSATDSHFAQFDGTTGKLLKDGGLALDTDGTLAANSDAKIATQKATKTYVDAKVAGLSWKQAVRVATTVAGTLASSFENGDTVDGVTLATGNRILIKNQAAPAENGIYVVAASGAPARSTDADSGAELVNASVYVSEGTTLADTQWTCTTNATITVGSTSLAFAQLTSGGSGDVVGPGSATDGHVALFDGATGKLLKDGTAAAVAAFLGTNVKSTESLIIACSDETTAITTGTAKVTFRMPYAFTLSAVRASVTTAPTGSTILIDINEAGSTILSTKLMIDASEKTSTTAATPAVISDTTLADDAEITVDFDQVGSSVAGTGVKVYLIGTRT